ncbi:MAG: hypothetical protein QOH69_1492 [Actinomycetota bacterium]|jgi:hypothetical protein|nr:hypothetical protein [Actinomycetota bacterium]
MPTENEIRDELAVRLTLIEPGLTLVEKNYFLRNSEGSNGFVDILARDSTGLFVILELKKSSNTSREALHEIGKYVDLLGRDKGIPLRRVRAMIVSTDWRELLVPFSYYASRSDFPFKGFQLDLDSDELTPVRLSEVEILEAPEERSLTESQRLIVLDPEQDPEVIWASLHAALIDLGVQDFVAAKLVSQSHQVSLAVALGTVWIPEARERLVSSIVQAGLLDEEDLEDETVEELVFTELSRVWRVATLGVCYPEKVGSLIYAHGWALTSWFRSGVFEDALVFPDSDLSDLVQGWTGGLSVGKYQGRARPANRLQWNEMVEGLDGALAGNESWRSVVSEWMLQVAGRSRGFDVAAHVYDPGDFLQTLVHGFDEEDLARLVPDMGVVIEDPVSAVGLIGMLAWNGQSVDLRSALASVYRSPGEWGDARAFGGVRETDRELLTAWNLRYVLWEKKAQDDLPKLLHLERGRLVRTAGRENFLGDIVFPGTRPLADFFDRYAGEIRGIVGKLKSTLVIDGTTATQLHFIDNTTPWQW